MQHLNDKIVYVSARVTPIPVSGISRYLPVYVGILSAATYLSIGADTSSPVVRLPVSTVNNL